MQPRWNTGRKKDGGTGPLGVPPLQLDPEPGVWLSWLRSVPSSKKMERCNHATLQLVRYNPGRVFRTQIRPAFRKRRSRSVKALLRTGLPSFPPFLPASAPFRVSCLVLCLGSRPDLLPPLSLSGFRSCSLVLPSTAGFPSCLPVRLPCLGFGSAFSALPLVLRSSPRSLSCFGLLLPPVAGPRLGCSSCRLRGPSLGLGFGVGLRVGSVARAAPVPLPGPRWYGSAPTPAVRVAGALAVSMLLVLPAEFALCRVYGWSVWI